VLVFHIPSRPYGTAYHLGGRYLMRSGEALVAMSEDQLRRIFAEGGPGWVEEHSKSGLDAQDVVDLLDTQSFFELLKLPYPTERPGVIDRLVRERLVDFRVNTYAIRRLGALVLAKRLGDFADVARRAPRVVVYAGTSKLETRLDETWTQRLCGRLPGSDSLRHGPDATERRHRRRAAEAGQARPGDRGS
jgi:hypothetical protein